MVDPRGQNLGISRARLVAVAATVAVLSLVHGKIVAAPAPPPAGKARYYFRIGDVKAPADVGAEQKQAAGEALRAELSARPSWASEVSAPEGDTALVAELKKRGLRGFDVTLRLEEIKREVRETSPGARLKKLVVNVRLTVFGTAIPGAKLAFSGEGEAGVEAEVNEKRVDAEASAAITEVVKDAIRQAVDQAEAKLSLGTAAPLNESRRRKK